MMASPTPVARRQTNRWPLLAAGVAIAALAAWMTRDSWRPGGAAAIADKTPSDLAHADVHGRHDEIAATSIELSDKALKNIGYRAESVALRPFERTASMPAIVIEQPGRTQIHLTAPFTGVLTEISVVQGEAIEPGAKMFEVRLTHEELVTAQQDYLKTAESLDVIDREIARLKSLGEGVVAGRRILEQEYEKQKFEAALRASEQALLLHGLTEAQVANILTTRQLLRTLTVTAPEHFHAGDACAGEHLFHVQRLPVSVGQQVDTSQELAVIADHCELYVEGRAFEDDAARLREALRENRKVTATLLAGNDEAEEIDNLELLRLADQIDAESRAFHFYLRLPNQIVSDRKTPDGKRFIDWRFKPGQRMELHVPVERWEERVVLPVEAVVEDGAERYVYRQNGDRFERVAVHVEYRDRNSAVIANDGALFPGDVIAARGAYQMHLALKNQSGGGTDPHAGHSH